jgi:hypothetical protein
MIEPAGRIYETCVVENEDRYLCLSPKEPVADDDFGKIVFNVIGNVEVYCGFIIGLSVFLGDNKWRYTWEDCKFSNRGFITESSPHWYALEDFHEAVKSLEWCDISIYFVTMGDGYHNQHFATKDPVSFLRGFNLAKTDILNITHRNIINLRVLEMNEDSIIKQDIALFLKDDPNTHVEIYDLR